MFELQPVLFTLSRESLWRAESFPRTFPVYFCKLLPPALWIIMHFKVYHFQEDVKGSLV
jgi:hypothetical protein